MGEAAILHLTNPSGVALAGRVLDAVGRPVVGSVVHLLATSPRPGGRVIGDDLVKFENGYVLEPDAEGRFRTPRELDPDGEYQAHASAPGFLPAHTLWTVGKSGSFPVMRLLPEPE